MAGLLFDRAGVSVRVLEKHVDFFRDFRGDTVHLSTTEIGQAPAALFASKSRRLARRELDPVKRVR